MNYILVWNGVNGRVLAKSEIIFDTDQKPNLGFNYDTLNLDTNLNQATYTFAVPDAQMVMTSELDENQLTNCYKYCDTFFETQDYEIHAYNEDFVYLGTMLKSKATSLGMKYTIAERPDIFTSKWDEQDQQWYPVYAAFKEDGFPVMAPQMLTNEYVSFLTKKEWNLLPPRPSAAYSLDFPTNTWKDKRVLARVKFDAIMDVRVYYEHSAIRNIGYNLPNEMASWVIQKQEAEEYLKDDTVKTLFLDGFISANPDVIKLELCARILEDYQDEQTYQSGVRHGQMYSYIYRIKRASSNEEVDVIMKELYELIGKYRIINTNQLYQEVMMSKQLEEGVRSSPPETIVFNNGKLIHVHGK